MTIAAEDPRKEKGRGRRRLFRAFLGCGFFVLVLVTIAALIIVPKTIDEPPFEAADLELAIPEIPSGENAATAFMEIWKDGVPKLPTDNERDIAFWDAAEAGELLAALEADPEIREGYWEPTIRMLERIDEAAQLPQFQFPVLMTIDGDGSHLGALKDTIEANWFRAHWLLEKGERAHLLQVYESWARFSAQLSSGVLDSVAFIISIANCGSLCGSLSKHLPETTGDLHTLLAQLDGIQHDRTQVSDTLRVEFQTFRNTLADPEFALTEGRSFVERWLFLPHQTERIYGEHLRAAIVEGEKTGRVTRDLEVPDLDGLWDALRVGNVIGWSVIGLMAVADDRMYRRAGIANSALRATQLMVALVIYEEQHGELPAQLDALVPGILPAVPLDPFDGKPIRYDRERRIVWAVGEDGVDGGGVGEPGSWRDADIVVAIPQRAP